VVQNLHMTTFAASLKKEIARVARKELRDEISALRKGSSTYRSEIAELKRKIKALESKVKALSRTAPSVASKTVSKPGATLARAKPGRKLTLGAAEFSALRQRLGFTQAQMAQLVGASALSIYKWESGQVTPRAAQLEKIISVRKIGKREAVARLQAE
jgi:DNA-binding transcriptional regulator YiaG